MANVQFINRHNGSIWEVQDVAAMAARELEADESLVTGNLQGVLVPLSVGQTIQSMLGLAEKERQTAAQEEAQDDVLFWHLRERILTFLANNFTVVAAPDPKQPGLPVPKSTAEKDEKPKEEVVRVLAPPRTVLTIRLWTDPDDTAATSAMFETVAAFIRDLKPGINLQGVDLRTTGGK